MVSGDIMWYYTYLDGQPINTPDLIIDPLSITCMIESDNRVRVSRSTIYDFNTPANTVFDVSEAVLVLLKYGLLSCPDED